MLYFYYLLFSVVIVESLECCFYNKMNEGYQKQQSEASDQKKQISIK